MSIFQHEQVLRLPGDAAQKRRDDRADTWSSSSTTFASASIDVDVQIGDRVSLQREDIRYTDNSGKAVSYDYAYPRIQNARFKTGGENLIPRVYAPVEND